ncbi:MAG: hypothetical protein ACFFF4_04720 [Candidatus Thorarchaeota archaeon]
MYDSPRSSRGVLSWPRACLGCGSSNIVETEKWSFYSKHEESKHVGYNMIQKITHTLKADGQLHFCPRCIDYLEKNKRFNIKVQAVRFVVALSTALVIFAATILSGYASYVSYAYLFGGLVASMYYIWRMITPFSGGKKQDRFMKAEASANHQTIKFTFRSPTFGTMFDRVNAGTIQTIDPKIGKYEVSGTDLCCIFPILLILGWIVGGFSGTIGVLFNLIFSLIVIEILPDLEPKPGEVPDYTGNTWAGDSSTPIGFKSGDFPSDIEEPFKPPDKTRPEDEFEWG